MTVAVQDFPRAFGVHFKDLLSYWEVRSVRISITNHCEWETVRLGDVCRVRFDAIPEEELLSGDVKLLDRISFDEGKVFAGKRTTTKMTQYRAKPGDIVVSKINARKRAIGIVSEGSDIGITIHFRALIPDTEKFDRQFLWLALRNPYCTNQFEIETGGIGKGEISEAKLLDVRVPFPPLGIQKKIVAVWEQAQAQIFEAQENIVQIEKSIEVRFFNDLGLPFPKRADRIKSFAVWWRGFKRWSVSYNQAAQTSTDLTRGLYPVYQFGDLVEFFQYGTNEKANNGGDGVPVLRINNVKNGLLDVSDLKYVRLTPKTRARFLLQDGDLLIVRTSGSRDLVGTCAVFHEKTDFVFASYLIRMRVFEDKVYPDFVSWFINSALGRQQVNAISRQIMQNNINSEEIRRLQIPLPPLDVQREIMRRVEEGRKQIRKEQEAIERLTKDTKEKVERMISGLEKG